VVQGFGIQADELAVLAGLAVGHDDVGCGCGSPQPGFVLVGGRYEPG
jgi:hypothetical protein